MGWAWKMAQWLQSLDPPRGLAAHLGDEMDLPLSRSKAWSLSVNLPIRACWTGHEVCNAFDTLGGQSYRGRVGSCLPLSSQITGCPSPRCRCQLSGHVLHCTTSALQLVSVKLRSQRVFISDAG